MTVGGVAEAELAQLHEAAKHNPGRVGDLACRLLATIAARDAEIERLRVEVVYVVEQERAQLKLTQAAEARVAQLEAAARRAIGFMWGQPKWDNGHNCGGCPMCVLNEMVPR